MIEKLFRQATASLYPANESRIWGPLTLPVRASAGINIDEATAMSYGAVFASVKVISETIAMLPWRVYRQSGKSREILTGDPLDTLLHLTPNSEIPSFQFREFLLSSALLHGNGYAEIERDRFRQPIALWPMHPESVTPSRDAAGRLHYKVRADGGENFEVAAENMFHLRGPTRDLGLVGWSILSLARESIGGGVAAERFAGGFFGNAGVPSIALVQGESTVPLSKQATDNLLESFERRHRGASNAGRPALLEPGWEIKQLGVPQKDAQFIESRRFSVADVARWFRVPPHKIGDLEKATFSNIEEQERNFANDAILPWAVRLELEAFAKLVVRPDVYTKIDLRALLRGNSKDRSEYYKTMRDLGAFSVDDILELEDRNPIGPEKGGDLRLVPLNMVPLDQMVGGFARSVDKAKAVLADVFTRFDTKARRAGETAEKRGKDPGVWASEFFLRHQEQLVEALHPSARLLGSLLNADEAAVDARVAQMAEQVCMQATAAFLDGGGATPPTPQENAEQLAEQIKEFAK